MKSAGLPIVDPPTGSKESNAGGTLVDVPSMDFTLAGSLEELKAKGQLVVRGAHRPILVVHDRGRVGVRTRKCTNCPVRANVTRTDYFAAVTSALAPSAM